MNRTFVLILLASSELYGNPICKSTFSASWKNEFYFDLLVWVGFVFIQELDLDFCVNI